MSVTGSTIGTAVLLAAGRGSRLAPHTDSIPKPLLPYRGKPTLEWIITALAHSGIRRLVIVTHYLEEQIIDFLRIYSGTELQITTVTQQTLSGTADAIMQAIAAVPDWFNESFIVSATDYLVENTFYTDLVQFHLSHDSDMSISLKRMPESTQSMRSSVRINPAMQISEVVEKPAPVPNQVRSPQTWCTFCQPR